MHKDDLIHAPHLNQRSPIRYRRAGIDKSPVLHLQILESVLCAFLSVRVCVHEHICVWLRLQPVLKNLLINRLITIQSPRALSSVLSQPPEGSLVILVCSEGSHPWKQDPKVTLPLPAGPGTCIRKQVSCG